MRLSKSYFFTLRENAADEDSISSNLLVRAGMIKKTSAGVYMLLPLGYKAMKRVEKIIREEMLAIDSLEVSMPALIPEEVYVESGRRANFGKSMFALKDRFDRDFVLGPTHEELFAAAARMAIKSYKDLPFSLFQFQTKFRDEPRPRFGLIRVREFVMKDAYTFDKDLEGLDVAYGKMFQAYKNAFDRMGLNYVIVRADTGVMGGLLSEEFQALSDIGEDILVLDDANGYASNLEVAACRAPEQDQSPQEPYEKVYTPDAKTIEEVTAFLQEDVKKFVKTLIYNCDGKLYAVCVRGDHEVNETKLQKLLGVSEVNLATPEEVLEATGAPVGFAGPVGVHCPVLVDLTVAAMANFICGANEDQHHFKSVNMRDFSPEKVADLRQIQEGDLSEKGGPVRFARGIEVGNTFKLGTKYSEAMDLFYMDENNQLRPVVMGSYGIGPGRCMAAIVAQNNNEKGILWPKAVAPIQVAVVPVNSKDKQQVKVAEDLYQQFLKAGYDVLIDDRNERAGVKFNDMELIGVYTRVTVGRAVADGEVEILTIGDEAAHKVKIEDAFAEVAKILA